MTISGRLGRPNVDHRRASGHPLVNFVMERSLLEEIEDFRFEHRFPTRSEAMKFLMWRGLKQDQVDPAEVEQMREQLAAERGK